MSKIVLCGANAYEEKYFFNPEFNKIPQSIQEELHLLCVFFTEEAGGIFMVSFEEDGSLLLETTFAEDDFIYDEINSGLRINEIRRNKQELLEALTMYYKVFVLGQKGQEE